MNAKINWITRSAVSIALIIVIQYVTLGLGQQLITGSLVNLVLALPALLFGCSVGATAAVISPFAAYFLGINAQIVIVPAIAAGNLTYVLVIALLAKFLKGTQHTDDAKCSVFFRNLFAVAVGALCKFGIQYLLIVKWIAPAFLPPKAQTVMSVVFGINQLLTASIGGVLACLIYGRRHG